jgi:glutamine synthetase
VFKAYGSNNRTLMCRLPVNRRCLEIRNADSAANLYQALAVSIAAGLDGIERELDPGPAINFDTYTKSKDELAAAGVHRLPRNLGEALDAFLVDSVIADAYGKEFHADFEAYKRLEWDEYNTVVGQWEVEKYLRLW